MALGTALLLLQLVTSSPADVPALRRARDAQERFEVTRRLHLPRGTSASRHRCDVEIGRYCYWYDSTETQRPPEPARITAAREQLNAALDVAARALPGDEWIAGQRVRYLIDAGQFDAAVAAARGCAADGWWCDALEGLALHAAQRYVASDSAFGRALAGMSPERRCEWTDLRLQTAGALSKEIARASCEDRAAIARRLWQLGRPLWSTPGNDLATEHFARRTMALILERAATTRGSSFGADNRELLLRYGWTEWFTRDEPTIYQVASPGMTGHSREPSYNFLPDIRSAQRAPRVTSRHWGLRSPAASTRYAPRHVEWMGELRHQLARFPRGDSTLVVVAYRVTDAALGRDSVFGALAWLDDDGARVVAASRDSQPIRGIVGRDTGVASIEVVGARSKRVERSRYTVDPLPCSTWCLSDPLLFVARDSARDVSIDDALAAAVSGGQASGDAPLGVYWEIEGVERTPMTVTLTIEPVAVSRLRRLAARVKLASEPSPVRLRWTHVAESSRSTHGLALRLPANAHGRLRVVLSVEPRGSAAQTVSREIEVVR